MTEAQAKHRAWLEAVTRSLAARQDVVGIVAMGSTADASRVDEWSDHDIAIVVEDGAVEAYRDGTAWLPEPHRLVARAVEYHGGGKAVYDDGRLVEWGVATLEGLRTWVADDYRVLVDRGGVKDVADEIASVPFPANDGDLERDTSVFLFELIHGVGRWRRGERVSAGGIIRGEASAALLRAARSRLDPEQILGLDRLDGLRRIEHALPDLARDVAAACALDVEDAASALLAAGVKHLGIGPGGLDPAGVAAVEKRLGWRRS